MQNQKWMKKQEVGFHWRPRSLAPHPPFIISRPPIHLFSSYSITFHLVSIAQGPLSELPAYDFSSV